MKEKIIAMIKSQDKEVEELGISLAKECFTVEDLKSLNTIRVTTAVDIAIAIDQRDFLKEKGWDGQDI